MKFTLSWLKDHLDTDASLDQICERLTSIGLEVEHVDDKSAYKPFVIAKILTAEKHPEADRLKVLTVDAGDGKPVQIVCGAPNARAGMVGALARPGTYVPGIDVTLAVGKIRGVESHGMMCSEKELNMSDNHEGIIDLPEDAPVGTSFASYAGLDDPVIEINLTPNRPDCTSIFGIARDLAASGLGTLKQPKAPSFAVEGETPHEVKIVLDDERLCPGFAYRLVRGVKNGPSPKWMQQRLLAIGLRPISALVDVTNYMTFDQGRPMHVFDADKVKGVLTVRRAQVGEEVLALDTRTYKLNPANVVIADDNGVESIGGIMGGEHSGCDENTVNVLIESALWDPINIAKTGRGHGIITDARYRFERGVDPEYMVPGLERTTELVLDMCGGTATAAKVAGYRKHEKKVVDFPFAEVKRLTGLTVSNDEARAILTGLGFEVSGTGERVSVSVPSWRPDVDGKADLVEEVMRMFGVDNIKPEPLPSMGSVNGKILTTLQIRTRTAKRALAARGMMEAVTWSFISAEHAKLFGGGKPSLKLVNPIAADMSDMRPSLLPGLLTAAQRNADRGFGDVAIFEVSGTYEADTPEGQRRVAGGIRRGTASLAGAGRAWSNATKGGGKPVTLWVSEDFTRAGPGGTGAAKCGGNYAGSLLAQAEATKRGCDQVVFLDAAEHRWVEELGGMNVFFVMNDGSVVTPPLAGTILPGITRASIIKLATENGLNVVERPYSFEEWQNDATSGKLREAFACGTAAVVAAIGTVRHAGGEFVIGNAGTGMETEKLRNQLTGIQRGTVADSHGWVKDVTLA